MWLRLTPNRQSNAKHLHKGHLGTVFERRNLLMQCEWYW
jgi:hypothetical protein